MVLAGIILETRGQIEAVIERGVVFQRAVVEEVADKQGVLVVDGVVEPQQQIVIVGVAGDVQVLQRESDARLELVNGRDVLENNGVIVRRLAAALALIVAEQEGAVLDERAAESETVLVLSQLVEFTINRVK